MTRDRISKGGALRFVRWPFLFAASGAAFLIVGVSAGRETYQQWKVDQEIKGLQTQVETLEGRRITLLDTIQKLSSADELDKEARLRLDLKKPGERVIVLRGFTPGSADDAPAGTTASSAPGPSNPQKWFAYFFSNKN